VLRIIDKLIYHPIPVQEYSLHDSFNPLLLIVSNRLRACDPQLPLRIEKIQHNRYNESHESNAIRTNNNEILQSKPYTTHSETPTLN
jgi:hypothetical protein